MKNQKIGYVAKNIHTKKYIVESIIGILKQTDDIDEANYEFIKVDYGVKIIKE